jgi:putative acetyltransferase
MRSLPQLVIRPERPEETSAVRAVHEAAFGRSAEADLVDALRESQAWLPHLCFVAARPEGRIVGHIVLSRIAVGTGGALGALALGPIAVLPSEQRRGVGGALMRSALDAAAAAGERLVILVGDPAYYGRFGFGPASRLGVTGPYDVPDEVFQALPLPAYDGSPRGLARYPAAWDAVS